MDTPASHESESTESDTGKASTNKALARQWEILRNHLPSGPPGRTASEICKRLAAAEIVVSKRTVERDLNQLELLFPLVCNDKSVPHGWYLLKNFCFDVPGLDLTECLSLCLMEDLLHQLMPPALTTPLQGKFELARTKLDALPSQSHARWREWLRYVTPGLPVIPPTILPNVLHAIQQALVDQQQLLVDYQNAAIDQTKALTLHPLAFIQQGARSYLVATAFDYQEPKLYALHRMASASLLKTPIKRPTGFSLDAYLASGAAQFGAGGTIQLKARIGDTLAHLLEEAPISKDQNISTRAGIRTLTATVTDSWQLHFWILSQGAQITVIQPTALRKTIVSALKKSLANYQDELEG
jgi:predicted DNA-binding transcriptional regulator YafY